MTNRSLTARAASLLALLAASAAAQTNPPAHHVKASLVSESAAFVPGRTLAVGVRLEMEQGWHTYWQNPGDSGLATRIAWRLPAGVTAGETLWPYPARFEAGPVVSFGYDGQVLLPVELQVARDVAKGELRLEARVNWLECKEVCIPGKAELALVLPMAAVAGAGPDAALFAEARRRLPAKAGSWHATAVASASEIALSLKPPKGTAVASAYFYPETPRVLDYSRAQPLQREGSGIRLDLPRDANGMLSGRLAGVVVAETGHGTLAVEVDAALSVAGVR